MMFELKRLSRDSIDAALQKVERYRLLNEAWQAESICRDVLRADPGNQRAITALILSLTDQFRTEGGTHADEARSLLPQLTSEYARAYYAGIICERQGTAQLNRNAPGAGAIVWDWLKQAMEWYERAEAIRPAGNDDALLRWNTCARVLERHPHVRPGPDHEMPDQLE